MLAAMAQNPLWHICGIALVILLAALHRRSRRSGIFVLALWNLAGVILHELAHLLVGGVLGGEPTGISLIPRREGARWRLGSVTFARITAVNAVPVALAPLGLAGVAWLVAKHWFAWFRPSLPATLALYAACFVLLYNALPSRQDLRIAMNWRSLLLYASLAALVFLLLEWPRLRHFVV